MTYRHREAAWVRPASASDGCFFQSAPDADLAASTSVHVEITSESRRRGSRRATWHRPPPTASLPSRPRANGRSLRPSTSAASIAWPARLGAPTVMPRVGSIEDNQEPAATQAFAAGLEQQRRARLSAQLEVSEQRMGELVRAFFEGDFLTDFDSVYLLDGNSVRQYKASVQQRLTDKLAGSVTVRYGSIDGDVSSRARRLRDHRNPGRSGRPARRSRSCRRGPDSRSSCAACDRTYRLRPPCSPTTPTSSRSRSRRISRSSA